MRIIDHTLARLLAACSRGLRDTSGVAAVELALMAPFLALLMTGGYDFSHALYEQHRLAGAARAGVQYAIRSSTAWTDSTDIIAAVRADANDTASALTVATSECTCPTGATKCSTAASCTGSTVAGTYVQVTVSESLATVVNYPFITTPLALSSKAIVRVQ
jgi:Flp pilus assembly protein TadG